MYLHLIPKFHDKYSGQKILRQYYKAALDTWKFVLEIDSQFVLILASYNQ